MGTEDSVSHTDWWKLHKLHNTHINADKFDWYNIFEIFSVKMNIIWGFITNGVWQKKGQNANISTLFVQKIEFLYILHTCIIHIFKQLQVF